MTPDGLKFIVTTNHLDRLDPAIVRPGRIDEVVEVGPLSRRLRAKNVSRLFRPRRDRKLFPAARAELQRIFSTLTPEEAEAELAKNPVALHAVRVTAT